MRKRLKWLGAILVVFSFYLLLREIIEFGPDVMRIASEPKLLILSLAASFGYAALLALPAAAWSHALTGREDDGRVSRTAVLIYARCNILKYLPGNIFHFGGRQLLANEAGWSHGSVLRATTLEIMSLPLAAGFVAVISFAVSMALSEGDLARAVLHPAVTPVSATLGVAFACVVAVGIAAMVRHWGPVTRSVAAMAVLQIVFFVASASLVVVIAMVMTVSDPADLALIAAAYCASWVVGFVVPGAPGGLGVREAAFVHLAAVSVSAPAALALVILARLVTTLGDLWFSLFASALTASGTPIREGASKIEQS